MKKQAKPKSKCEKYLIKILLTGILFPTLVVALFYDIGLFHTLFGFIIFHLLL